MPENEDLLKKTESELLDAQMYMEAWRLCEAELMAKTERQAEKSAINYLRHGGSVSDEFFKLVNNSAGFDVTHTSQLVLEFVENFHASYESQSPTLPSEAGMHLIALTKSGEEREEFLDDYREMYQMKVCKKGRAAADRWHRQQVHREVRTTLWQNLGRIATVLTIAEYIRKLL